MLNFTFSDSSTQQSQLTSVYMNSSQFGIQDEDGIGQICIIGGCINMRKQTACLYA